MNQQTTTKTKQPTFDRGWSRSGSFLESILSGALIGYLLDQWWGTEPWMVITGVVLGSYTGFMRIWALLKEQDELDLGR